MDELSKKAIEQVNTEVMATQTVLVALMLELKRGGTVGVEGFNRVFEFADNLATVSAYKFETGDTAVDPAHLMSVIDQLRSLVLEP